MLRCSRTGIVEILNRNIRVSKRSTPSNLRFDKVNYLRRIITSEKPIVRMLTCLDVISSIDINERVVKFLKWL
jgi:hypothetical protein